MGALLRATPSRYWSTVWSVPWIRMPAVLRQSGVRIRPGLMVLTRMLNGMSSLARHFVNITRAALVVL